MSDPVGDLLTLSIMRLQLSIIAVIRFIWSGLICPVMFIPAWSPIMPWVLGGWDGGWAS